MSKYFYLFVCVCAAISVVEAVKTPVVHRVAQRLEKLQAPQPVPTQSAADAKNNPRFQQKSGVRRDCPSGSRQVQTTMPEYGDADPTAPVSSADLNNAVGGALSLTFSPIQAVSLTGIDLSDTGGSSLLLTGATGSVESGSTGSVQAPGLGSTAPIVSDDDSTGGTGGDSSAASCPLSPEEVASLPADLYGHADFSNAINTAQDDINEQENLQWISDANGGYDYNKLISDADQLQEEAEPYLDGSTGGAGTGGTGSDSAGSTGAR